MTPPSHFKRIARDLEKLPCELHNSVLVELEFAQLIRLSSFAGPRLQWSLENSLSSWGIFFKKEGMAQLQRLLIITDQVKRLCFRMPTEKGELPYAFRYGTLRFLQYRDSDWRPRLHGPNPELHDQTSVIQRWLGYLNIIVIDATWDAFHEDYAKLIKPWLDVAGADVFRKIPEIGKDVSPVDQGRAFSIDDLSDFITSYQCLRRTRAEHLANELRDLANIYEAHSDRIKMPFAPQTHRPNKSHIPNQMRAEANILIRRAANGRWIVKQTAKYRFRYLFPALVPYDWTTRLFNETWNSNSSKAHSIILDNCKIVAETYPVGMLGLETRQVMTLLTPLTTGQNRGNTARLCKPVLKKTGDEYRAHPKEIKWLQRFAEVIAWMEETHPDRVREIRGDDFWVRERRS